MISWLILIVSPLVAAVAALANPASVDTATAAARAGSTTQNQIKNPDTAQNATAI